MSKPNTDEQIRQQAREAARAAASKQPLTLEVAVAVVRILRA